MKMHRKQKVIIAYILHPVVFLLLSGLLWLVAGKPVYDYLDAKICMLIINNAPNKADIDDPQMIAMKAAISENEEIGIGNQNGALEQGEQQEITYGTQYGTILCETRGLEAPLYYGDDDELLRLGAGQYKDSTLPGYQGVSIIGAHDTTYFAPLKDMQVGDEIQIQTSYGDFSYVVDAIHTAHMSDTSAYQLDSDKETVILYTCYPFGEIQETREYRYYVYCKRTN